VPVDDGAGGLREGDDARGPLERFQPPRDLRLLQREPLTGERLVGFIAQLGAKAGDPAFEFRVTRAARGAVRQMRVYLSVGFRRSPLARELRVVQMTPPETLKK
jgi:hypothetical protein